MYHSVKTCNIAVNPPFHKPSAPDGRNDENVLSFIISALVCCHVLDHSFLIPPNLTVTFAERCNLFHGLMFTPTWLLLKTCDRDMDFYKYPFWSHGGGAPAMLVWLLTDTVSLWSNTDVSCCLITCLQNRIPRTKRRYNEPILALFYHPNTSPGHFKLTHTVQIQSENTVAHFKWCFVKHSVTTDELHTVFI